MASGPQIAADLRGFAKGHTDAGGAEEGVGGTVVFAEVEVHVGAWEVGDVSMLQKVKERKKGWGDGVRRADLQSWYLEGLLDRTEGLKLLVSILGCRSEQELVQGDTDIFLVARRRTEIIHRNHN